MDYPGFDWRNPDYRAVFERRVRALNYLRAHPERLEPLKAYYRENPWDFINDWGMTSDPRLVERGLPARVPFVLFPRQIEWVKFIHARWMAQERGETVKSRDMGVSWLAMSLASTLCLFHNGLQIGVGSRKEEYVDKSDMPKSLLYKGREFIAALPREFRGDWTRKKHAPHMLIKFPETGSTITGEVGDGVGRGDRAAIYFVDEYAFFERPMTSEASLSQTTNCRQDISTPNGTANPFAQQVMSLPDERVFRFHWRDDPRKDEEWYAKQVAELDPVILAQEVDLDFSASVEGVVIPSAWVQASVDAHVKLGILPTGERSGAFDVADEGRDLNAFCGGWGFLIDHLEEWSGKGGDTFASTERVINICDERAYLTFKYDGDGLGAGVRGDARVINERRLEQGYRQVKADMFRGSGSVFGEEQEDVKGRKNKDFFANRKAQAWWSLRSRFRATYRAVVEGLDYDPDDIISISSSLGKLGTKLQMELSQPTYKLNGVGKIVIDKAPEGAKSPNLADAVMIRYARNKAAPMRIAQG